MSRLSIIIFLMMMVWIRPESSAATEIPLLGNSWVTWGTSATAYLYDVNKNTGAATNPRDTGLQTLVGITADPSTGVLYGLTVYQSALYRIDRATGHATQIGFTGINGAEGDLDFDPTTGILYGTQWVASKQLMLFKLNKGTGQATAVGGVAGARDLSAMAFDANGNLYVLDTDLDELLRVDKHTATILSRVSCATLLGEAAGMDFDPATGTLYVADGATHGTNCLYTLDPASGAMNLVGSLGVSAGFAGLAFAVPEPTILLLVACGGITLTRRRRPAAAYQPCAGSIALASVKARLGGRS
jgi:DNA-binding beta-propeller fold protein YncE